VYTVDPNIVMQQFSPLFMSQWFMIDHAKNPCSSIRCENDFLFVFKHVSLISMYCSTYRILHELSFNINFRECHCELYNVFGASYIKAYIIMTTMIRFFLSHDFTAHRPNTGHIFNGFLACSVSGYIGLVLYWTSVILD